MSLPEMMTPWARPMQSPAYNAVAPRTTLQQAPAPVGLFSTPHARPALNSHMQSPMGSVASRPKKVEWPPAVRDYVRRAFDPANAIEGIDLSQVQTKLKTTISFFAERDAHDTIDWPTYPLPQQLLQEEKRQAALSASDSATNGHTNLLHSSPARKRKSQDPEMLASPQSDANLPPWRKTNLQSRMTYQGPHEKRHKKNAASGDALNNAASGDAMEDVTSGDAFSKFDQADLDKRRRRFQLGNGNGNHNMPPWGTKDEDETSTAPVVGTNLALEKSYFRLTAAPKPETVRPLHVLEKTLAMLRQKWKAEKNYNYVCKQFKSLRQDLTVQHIKNAFTVKVYEIHARISLEKGDLGEYNQCQTQLKALYAQGLEGKPEEFKAYRILYIVYTCNKSDMNDMLAELTLADKSHPWIKHALDVRSALALGNYHKFFKLYLAAENMGSYLMDMFIERERLNALANISRG
jgi:hypothetical protein